MRKRDLYRTLVQRYLDRTASPEELQVFFYLLEKGKLTKELQEATQEERELASVGKLRHLARRYAVAAAAIGLLGAGLFFWRTKVAKHETPAFVSVYHNDIAPGSDRATLLLADGSHVALNGLGDDRLQKVGGRIKDDDRLHYRRLTTPAAGQYHLTLADGTRVWLNSQSSIRYPSAFVGKTRFVEVTGEAYFDVAKDPKRPFIVKAGNLTIQALGTQFNVHAYPDELFATATLIQGSVRVIKGNDSLLLRPGQEGQTETPVSKTGTTASSPPLTLNTADTTQATAWRDGYFDFDNKDIQSIMRQFARWYDIQVVFAGKPSLAPFAGRMQRSLTLSQVMIGLGRMGVHSRLEGRTLTILP